MNPPSPATSLAPILCVASYNLKIKLGLSILVAIAALIIVGAELKDPTSPSSSELLFVICAILFSLLAFGLLLTIWRDRVLFGEEGMLISHVFKTYWKPYRDLAAVRGTDHRVDLKFSDGSKIIINRHMGDLALVSSVLRAKAPNGHD